MAASVGSQHRCVFVGNIPYDATEEQLVQICEEVGPVVSFRLVSDRETGKPKGYGFCEYKDEETALSARRNLQGYEINGRQLRVDFAENDKNADRNREQGRGGPGLASRADVQKQPSGAPNLVDPLHQPIGFPFAATAANAMAAALGGAQTSNTQNMLHNHSGNGNDSLTHYLSRLSRHQLLEIMSEMKTLTTQNKPLVRQLLQSSPQLTKALFQAQVILGMVTPQMIAGSGQTSSLAPSGQLSKGHENQLPVTSHTSGHLQQAMLPLQQIRVQPQYQLPPLPQNQVSVANAADKFGVTAVPSRWPQSIGSLPVQPQQILQRQPTLPQLPVPTAIANIAHNSPLALPNVTLQQSNLIPPLTSQPGSSSGLPQVSTSTSVQGSTWPSAFNKRGLDVGFADQSRMSGNLSEQNSYPIKFQRLDDGTGAFQRVSNSAVNTASIKKHGTSTVAMGQVTADVVHSEKSMPQLLPDVESALLQQVLSLTPEQLSSLPLEQQQQIIQLQKMLSAHK
ncbi:cleavage stimulating factor 64-like isoform X2 [Zingiber officinale]|uniref:cleavage stimulating factor 64-like isoform X2 n=1 Tax=Zingiber officinale TaxID=94328 RepID=UPI001C4AAEE7|nr:cleavage stimulating factor 64-like isoform X2 [Zingiber officinale]